MTKNPYLANYIGARQCRFFCRLLFGHGLGIGFDPLMATEGSCRRRTADSCPDETRH